MDTKTQELLDRTFLFGVNILKFLMTLPSNDGFQVPRYQVAKASTSIGANYEEAQGAESRQDFIHKIAISLKEARESHYWLRVLRALVSVSAQQAALDTFVKEAAELKNIFAKIKVTAQKKTK